jgi:hypothetical protein
MARCPHCNAHAVRRPSNLWKLAHAGAWAYAALSVLGASLVGPFIVALVPMLLFGGTCLLAETHRRATAPAVCDACDRLVDVPARTRPPARVHATGALDLADAR